MLFWLMNIKNEWLTINDKKDILDCNVFWEGKETKMIKKGQKNMKLYCSEQVWF